MPRARHGIFFIFVNAPGHDGGAVFHGQGANVPQLFLAVFQVHAVKHASSAGELQACFHHFRVGAVEHERGGQGINVPPNHLVHIAHAVAAHEIDAHIEHVRAVFHFVARHAHQAVEIIHLEQFTKLLAAVGVGPLGDDEIALILADILGVDQ